MEYSNFISMLFVAIMFISLAIAVGIFLIKLTSLQDKNSSMKVNAFIPIPVAISLLGFVFVYLAFTTTKNPFTMYCGDCHKYTFTKQNIISDPNGNMSILVDGPICVRCGGYNVYEDEDTYLASMTNNEDN